jgi:hypothetical protein
VTTLTALTSSDVPETQRGGAAADRAFRLHCLDRDNTNLNLFKHRDWQGFMVTGQHSGTHWIKWMLSLALAHQYGLEPPRYMNNPSSNDFIGHPKHKRKHPDLPRVASTHSIPPNAAHWGWLRALAPLPPYAVVVRDIPDVLISNYEKWRERYGVSFSRYVAGDPWQKAYICDVWWYIRYLNQWGEVASRYPQDTMVMTYESFRDDPRTALERIARQLRLNLSPAALDAGVAGGTKEAMARAQDPDIQDFPVRADGAGRAAFSEEDRALMLAILDRHLRHDFGYGYFDKPRGFQI